MQVYIKHIIFFFNAFQKIYIKKTQQMGKNIKMNQYLHQQKTKKDTKKIQEDIK